MSKLILEYIQARLSEGSTWKGFFLVLSAFGLYALTPEQQFAVMSLGMALFGSLHVVLPDNFKDVLGNKK